MAIAVGTLNPISKKLIPLVKFSIGILLLLPGSLYAADNWAYQPSLEQDFSLESNPLMLSGSQKTLFGSVTIQQLIITDNTPTTQLAAKGSVSENIFNQSSFDSTDAHAGINLDKKLQRWEVGIIGQSDYDTTRTSELSTLNINTEGSIRHMGNSIAPTLAYNLTPVDKLSVAGSFQESHYDSNFFADYHIFSSTSSLQHNFNSLNTGTLSFIAQRYQAENLGNTRVDTFGPTVGWTSSLTPTLTLKLLVGEQQFKESGDGTLSQGGQWQSTYGANLNYKGYLDVVTLDASRTLQPYVNGTEFYLNTLALSDTHNLNSLFSTSIAASYQFSGNSDQTAISLKSLVSATAGVAYHVTDKIDLTTSYQYRDQTLTNVAGNQTDNVFLIGLVYRPKLDGAL